MPRSATSSAATRWSPPTPRLSPSRTRSRRMAVVEQENPLVEGLERMPVHPTTLVIFGGTGDLAQRKLLPAIYNLAHEGALPERFNLIAVSRSDDSNEKYRGMRSEE